MREVAHNGAVTLGPSLGAFVGADSCVRGKTADLASAMMAKCEGLSYLGTLGVADGEEERGEVAELAMRC